MEANLEAVEPVAVLELLGDAIDSTNAEDVLGQVAGFAEVYPTLVLDLGRVGFGGQFGVCGATAPSSGSGTPAASCCCATRRPRCEPCWSWPWLTRVLSLFDTRDQVLAAARGG